MSEAFLNKILQVFNELLRPHFQDLSFSNMDPYDGTL